MFRKHDLKGQNRKHRKQYVEMLRTWDGHLSGASLKEIAVELRGADTVKMDWADYNRALAKSIKRLLARAERLIEGGYKDLLRTADD